MSCESLLDTGIPKAVYQQSIAELEARLDALRKKRLESRRLYEEFKLSKDKANSEKAQVKVEKALAKQEKIMSLLDTAFDKAADGLANLKLVVFEATGEIIT